MSDDPHPCKVMKHFNISNFIVNTLILTATTAAFAQEQRATQISSDENTDHITLTIGAENTSALTLQENKTIFYNCLAPSFSLKTDDRHGNYAKVSGVEGVIYNNDTFSTATIKFMTELGKILGDGGVITFKAGREATEGSRVFNNQLSYYANASDIVTLGNGAERIVFGYEKAEQFIELGIIGNSGDGFYVIPNPKKADFWAKFGLTLLRKSGIKLDMTGAIRTGSQSRQLLSSLSLQNRTHGVTVFGHYDVKQHHGNLGARA